MEDERIVELFFARSEEALVETQRKFASYCRYIAYQILHSHEDAEECVNDAYLKLWQTIPPERPRDLRHFLGCITRRLALHRLEYEQAKKRRCPVVVSIEEYAECLPDGAETPADAVALGEAIDGFLRSLPQETRVMFLRRYWYHLSIREIAEGMGRSEGSVKVTLHRTRNRFRAYLEEEELL